MHQFKTTNKCNMQSFINRDKMAKSTLSNSALTKKMCKLRGTLKSSAVGKQPKDSIKRLPSGVLPTAFACSRPGGKGDIPPLHRKRILVSKGLRQRTENRAITKPLADPVWCSCSPHQLTQSCGSYTTWAGIGYVIFLPLIPLRQSTKALNLVSEPLSHQCKDLTESSLRWMETDFVFIDLQLLHAVPSLAFPHHHIQMDRRRVESWILFLSLLLRDSASLSLLIPQ